MPIPRARTSPRPLRDVAHADVRRVRRSVATPRIALAAVAVVVATTAVGCGRLSSTATGRSSVSNATVAGSLVAAVAATRRTPTAPQPAAAIAYDREGNAVAVQNFGDGRVPDPGDGPIWACRYFAIGSAAGSTLALGPELEGGPVTPAPGQLVWLSCPAGHDEYLAFDPARPFGTWAP